MAPKKRAVKAPAQKASQFTDEPPVPFRRPNEALKPFIEGLDPKHVYITHVDSHPAAYKRKIFLIPIALNVGVVLLFIGRVWWIAPWYWGFIRVFLGYQNAAAMDTPNSTWAEIAWEIGKRGLVMFFDFLLFIFVWPWPWEFVLGGSDGSPVRWRLNISFRDEEIYVRKSREWDTTLKDIFKDDGSMKLLVAQIRAATNPLQQEQKTGYLLMNGQWDLDWVDMVEAHMLVTKKHIAMSAFKNNVFVHHKDFGWLVYDVKGGNEVEEDHRRREVFAFRSALVALGKEDLFYRWVELVQFESTQPGGFGPEKQEAAAKKIREMFESQGVSFDQVWKDAVNKL